MIPTYPRPGALSASVLLGALATHRPNPDLAAILTTQPPATWVSTLGDAATLSDSGVMVRLAINLGASILTPGIALIHASGEFERACQLAEVTIPVDAAPKVTWVLTTGDPIRPSLGFSAGPHGAVAAIAALCLLSAAVRRNHQLPNPDICLWGPDEQPVDHTEARAAAAGMPTAWIAAAELAGVPAVLDTWTTGPGPHVPPDVLLNALYPNEPVIAETDARLGQPNRWRVADRFTYRVTPPQQRWHEDPSP
jgi:hypothetical protein